ncbi:hypothetical protein GCM10020000_73910 [Streptomyces olivoverticillatus]
MLEADVQLLCGGRVWAEIRGWHDRRFDARPETRAVERRPDRATLSAERPGGWQLAFEYWPDPASRELMMRNQLAGEEREEYARCPPRGRRQWLLGRIAAKDAVRRHLWRHGAGPVFPGEVRVRNEPGGWPPARGGARAAAAAARTVAGPLQGGGRRTRPPRRHAAGIDIEEITDRPQTTVDAVLAPAERELFRTLGGGDRWLTRFWTAKEAAAKAEGTGIQGRPRDFVVTAASPDRLRLRTPSGRTYTVRLAPAANPPGLPPRRYVVAWTEDGTGGRPLDDTQDHKENLP